MRNPLIPVEVLTPEMDCFIDWVASCWGSSECYVFGVAGGGARRPLPPLCWLVTNLVRSSADTHQHIMKPESQHPP